MSKQALAEASFEIAENVRMQRTIARPLYCFSVLYFLLPCLIFTLGFTQWYVILLVGIPLIIAACFDIRYELKGYLGEGLQWRDGRNVLLVFFLACAWTALFGAGFIGPQTGDQLKNHMIFRDLFVFAWPVVYPTMPADLHFLSYPLGYYLTPALLGKLFGWTAGTVSIFLWTALGIALLWSWFFVLFSRFAWFAILLFMLFSGLDILGVLLQGQPVPAAGTHVEWWSGWTFLQYSSNATVMAWSTQHGAAQWLFPMLMYYRLVCCKSVRGSALLVSIAAFWSHLTLFGIIVFLPLYLRQGRFLSALKDTSSLAIPFFLLVACFYASKAPDSIDAGFIWELWPAAKALPLVLFFYLLEFLLLALFIYSLKQFEDRDEILLFFSAVVLLMIVPLYHVGWSNDVSMRASAIPLFILFILFCATLKQISLQKKKSALAVGLIYIFIAALTPMNEIFRQWSSIAPQHFFTASLTDENWDRGVSRSERNCLITTVPRDFALRAGDQVAIYGNGQLDIASVQVVGDFQRICGAADIIINQRPVGTLSLKFYREGKNLQDKYHWRTILAPNAVMSIVSLWPQQYTGAESSFFYKYLLAN
jgi:hypothetical protein